MMIKNNVPLRNLKKLILFFISLSLIPISEAPAFADFNGNYKLQTMFLGNKKCLEGNQLAEDSTLGGAAFMDDCNNSSGQSWKLVPIGNDNYKLQTMFLGNKKCLEGNRLAEDSTLGGAAFMDDCNNSSGQSWKLVPIGNGNYKLQTMFLGNKKCLEGNRLAENSTLGGATFMDDCKNASGQSWKLVKINIVSKVMQRIFIHAPNGDFSKSHEDTIINYVTWGGTNWTAKVEGNKFIHAPNGDFSKSHEDTIINYVTWGRTNWTAKVE